MRAITVTLAILLARTAEAGDCVAADASTDTPRVDRDGVIACYDRCWRLDYATRAWTIVAAPAPVPEPPPSGPKLSFATKLRVCAPDCHEVTLPGVAAVSERDVTESPDRLLLAVRGPDIGKETPLYVFDAVTGARRATIHKWKTPMGEDASFQRVDFLGSALFVAISSSPVSSAGRLYDPHTGKPLATIGGPDANLDDSIAIDLGGNRWAFEELEASELYVYNVATGARGPSIRSGPKQGGYAALQVAHPASGPALLVGVRGTAGNGVMIYDLERRKASHVTVPLCK